MTELIEPPTMQLQLAPRPIGQVLATGLFGGVLLGVVARAWMRLIAEEPEFTWGGTIFIVSGFGIFGLTQAIAAVTRNRAKRRWTLTIARVIGSAGFLPLFVGAGGIMLPAVVGGGVAVWRTDLRKVSRWIWSAVAAAPFLFVGNNLVGSFGWSLHTAAGFLAMLCIYATIVSATRFTVAAQRDGWRLPRWVTVTGCVIAGLALVQLMAGFVFK